MGLRVFPCTLEQANGLVSLWHRHHKPCLSHRFSLGVIDDNTMKLHGACIAGRPVARETDQYYVIEISRLVTDGTKNACSILYSAAARVAREMGFCSIQTFILDSEPGTSLSAAGWTLTGVSDGGNWLSVSKSGRRQDQPQGAKQKYSKQLNKFTPVIAQVSSSSAEELGL